MPIAQTFPCLNYCRAQLLSVSLQKEHTIMRLDLALAARTVPPGAPFCCGQFRSSPIGVGQKPRESCVLHAL
jgi:hypothetical protein